VSTPLTTTAEGITHLSPDLPGASYIFHASRDVSVPPGTVLQVPILVSGIVRPIEEITVAVHVRHRDLETLSFALMSPDLRTVLLSAFHGGGATSLGESPDRPLLFTDHAPISIARGLPPLVGAYRPLSALAGFRGLGPSDANGRWHLVVMDVGKTREGAVVGSVTLMLRA
jgi:hypothetical protein